LKPRCFSLSKSRILSLAAGVLSPAPITLDPGWQPTHESWHHRR
jgi:hypothetical protein